MRPPWLKYGYAIIGPLHVGLGLLDVAAPAWVRTVWFIAGAVFTMRAVTLFLAEERRP